MLGHGGASGSSRRSRARAAIGALLVAASLVPGLSAVAAAGDEGSDDPTSSAPPATEEPATTVPATTVPATTEPATTTTTPASTAPPTTTAPTTTPPPTTTTPPTEPANVTAAASAPCSVARTLRRHDTGPGVVCLEQTLVARGHHISAPKQGRYDFTTVAAVRDVQRRRGILVTGVAGPATLSRLGIWSGTPINVPCSVGRVVLRGMEGVRARCVEQRLIQLGYIIPGPDRLFNPASARAAQAFQRRQGFVIANGAVGPLTLARLRLWSGPPLNFACTVSRPVLAGTRGAPARCVAQRLIQLGYALAAPDRNFGPSDVEFLQRYQSRIGVQADGRAGKYVLFSLGIWSGHNPYGPPPVPANSGSGRRIVYSRAMQRIWAIEADGTVVKTHLVSGRLYEPYAGTYSVYSRSMYTYSTADPNVKWRYMVRFAYGPEGGRIGFHEIPTRFGVPLQSESQLGQPLSGGCVRQSTADAIWTWNWAYLGTKVVVL